MEKTILLRRAVAGCLLFLFLFPSLHLLFYIDRLEFRWEPELVAALRGAFLQSTVSAILTLTLGLIGAWGLLALKNFEDSKSNGLRLLGLLPGFLPPLLVITLGFRSWPSLPQGLWGVVFLHILMNLGLASVMCEIVLREKAKGWLALRAIEGVAMPRFLLRGLLPSLRTDLVSLFFFFWLLCFTSFSVPFIVGGARYGGIEVFLYEAIFLYRDWGTALGLSMGLLLLFLPLSLFKPGQSPIPKVQNFQIHGGQRWGLSVFLSPFLILLFGLVKSLALTRGSLVVVTNFESAFRGSLLLGFGTGLGVFLIGSLVQFCFFSPKFSRLLFFALPPGWMIIAFSFFLLGSAHMGLGFLKCMLALSLIFFPFLFRLALFQKNEDLRQQVALCKVMGVSWGQIFFKVIWPQGIPALALAAGIAGAWATGDFAISSVLLDHQTTLALQMKDLLTGYHLSDAEAFILPLSLALAIVFLTFQGLGYVCRRQSL